MDLFVLVYIALAYLVVMVAIVYFKRKKGQQKIEQLKPLINDPNMVKVALWINIEQVNGVAYDGKNQYSTSLRNGLLNPNSVAVALFPAGDYHFVVSSNSRSEYEGIEMQAHLEAGQVYQLGCNEDGPYLVLDPQPERYNVN